MMNRLSGSSGSIFTEVGGEEAVDVGAVDGTWLEYGPVGLEIEA